MRLVCFASLALWLVMASLLLHSVVPLAIGAVFCAFLIVHRGLHSDWPLY